MELTSDAQDFTEFLNKQCDLIHVYTEINSTEFSETFRLICVKLHCRDCSVKVLRLQEKYLIARGFLKCYLIYSKVSQLC